MVTRAFLDGSQDQSILSGTAVQRFLGVNFVSHLQTESRHLWTDIYTQMDGPGEKLTHGCLPAHYTAGIGSHVTQGMAVKGQTTFWFLKKKRVTPSRLCLCSAIFPQKDAWVIN